MKEQGNTPVQSELSEEDNKQKKRVALAATYQGPVPPPAILDGYKEIDPSFPERIFRMAEKEQQFRHRSYFLGQLSAFTVVMTALLVAAYLGINGKEWLGGSIGLGALASIVAAYFYSQRKKDS